MMRYHKTPGSGQIENFDLATSRSFVATLPVHLFQSKYKVCIIQLSELYAWPAQSGPMW